ncbi:hypothetical protein [Serratia microhaemolytica]|uniref:hypothetical protein n=1 Tax=Serratia microhaemolytica TaxID=2675110 RepID=UPI000FDDD0CD|nr:hypothetical protein [Serratia microhaemolytica]
MFIKKVLVIGLLSILTTACSMSEISEINKKVSDGAESLMNAFKSDNGSADKTASASSSQKVAKKESTLKQYDIPVDVDTAAARLKRHYKFYSNEEVEAIRKKNTSGDWVASAITSNGQKWESMPGSYYKMGNNWGDYGDHLTIEVEKNGVGSRLYITYSSSSPQTLTGEGLKELMAEVKGVAEGTVR